MSSPTLELSSPGLKVMLYSAPEVVLGFERTTFPTIALNLTRWATPFQTEDSEVERNSVFCIYPRTGRIAEGQQGSLTRVHCIKTNMNPTPWRLSSHTPANRACIWPLAPVPSTSKMSSIYPVLCPSWLLWTLYPSSNPSFSARPWLEQQEIFLHYDSITKRWKSVC